MTYLAPSVETRGSKPAFANIRAHLQADKLYLIVLFALLLAWGTLVFGVYQSVEAPPIQGTERAERFALRLVKRTFIFGIALLVIRFIQHEMAKTGTSFVDNIKSELAQRPHAYAFHLAFFALAAVSFSYLQTNFMSLKTTIPEIVPFYLDPAARAWDLAIFGKDPWLYFEGVYDNALLMNAIDKLYMWWAALVAGFWVWALCSRRMERQRRYQYIFAMVLVWFIAGNVLATLLSSVGPVYYAEFFADADAFAALTANLEQANAALGGNLRAVNYQEYLLYYYYNPETRFAGISAIPSLHVATTLMMLFLFWRMRIAREVLIAYNLVIYCGSIILGWHYGVDGLISVPIALACWWLGGKMAQAIERRSPPVPS